MINLTKNNIHKYKYYPIFKKIYARVTRSLLLIIINAIPMASTTMPPATKLEIKLANEGVIL